MQVKTILNNCYKLKSFVYKIVFIATKDEQKCIKVVIEPRKNGQAICSCCQQVASCYDQQGERYFEFVPLWGYRVFFLYKMRRVNCKNCGVKIEEVPWSTGKHTLTKPYMKFLSDWGRKLSWKEVARSFKTSWQKVFASVCFVVEYGLQHQDISNVESLGVDEIAIQKGHKYLTVVYQIDKHCVRLLWIGKDRTIETLSKFFTEFGDDFAKGIKHICSDMWKPYLRVIKEKIPLAIHVLDRFHIVAKLNTVIDEVRASEQRKMQQDGYEPVLKKSRWCLLKRKENLTEKQEVKLNDLLKYNLKSTRAYLLKEDFDGLWDYVSASWASKFLRRWCSRAMKSKIEPIKKVAKTIRKHESLILNWFKAKKAFSSGIVEGLNNKVKVTTRKAYGFRTEKCAIIALYHVLGGLPEPQMTHRF